DAAPGEPSALFLDWLGHAIDAGLPAAHAATQSTADASGRVDARTLLLKDVDGDGWVFATRADSPKGVALAQNPNAALTFFWREHGRQVRVRGPVVPLGPERSEEHTAELQSREKLVCRLLLEKKTATQLGRRHR